MKIPDDPWVFQQKVKDLMLSQEDGRGGYTYESRHVIPNRRVEWGICEYCQRKVPARTPYHRTCKEWSKKLK